VLSWHQRIVDAIAGQHAEAAAAAMIEVIHNGLRRHEGSVPGHEPGEKS
jgi:DNA-binding GntR family transcriptional regulator